MNCLLLKYFVNSPFIISVDFFKRISCLFGNGIVHLLVVRLHVKIINWNENQIDQSKANGNVRVFELHNSEIKHNCFPGTVGKVKQQRKPEKRNNQGDKNHGVPPNETTQKRLEYFKNAFNSHMASVIGYVVGLGRGFKHVRATTYFYKQLLTLSRGY